MKKLRIKQLSLLAVSLLFLFSATLRAQGQGMQKPAEVKIKTSAVCGMCKDRIEKGLAFEKGVKSSELDLETKILTVNYRPDKTNPEKLRTAVSKLGYDADKVPADEKAYAKLPACCKKDAEEHK